MSKNILLASINPEGIANLSTFTLRLRKIAEVEVRYNAVKTACERVLARLEEGLRKVGTVKRGKRKGETVYSEGTKGIIVPYEIYNVKTEHVLLNKAVDIRSFLIRINEQMKEAKKNIEKQYNNAISSIVPEGAYNAYLYGVRTGSYYHNDKNDFSFASYVTKTCKNLGLLGYDDKKAVNKFTESMLVYFGVTSRKGTVKNGEIKTEACLKAMGESSFNRLYVQAIINRMIEKNVLKKTAEGLVKLSKEEAEALKTA